MNRSTASRSAFASLVALPLLPLCAIVLNGSPEVVFFMGATSFILGVMLLVCLFAVSYKPVAGSPPVPAKNTVLKSFASPGMLRPVKIRELARVLSHLVATETAISPLATEPSERVASSQRARHANIARLRALRDRYRSDLVNMLARVRELVTMIHLAKYTGVSASRAEELVVQIATSIEGLSEVAAWRDADCLMTATPSEVS